MGGERSGSRLGHPLSAMQVAPGGVSAIDAEVYYSFDCERSFRAEDFPKGILLPGLPLHLEQGRRELGFRPATSGVSSDFDDNSPAFQRWDLAEKKRQVPPGTQETRF